MKTLNSYYEDLTLLEKIKGCNCSDTENKWLDSQEQRLKRLVEAKKLALREEFFTEDLDKSSEI